MTTNQPVENQRPIRVVVIGGGYSGIYCGIRLSQRIRDINLTIYEKNPTFGGTWYANRYPGCACDIPSHSYQYSFEPNPKWSGFHATAREIQAYLDGVARKYSVNRFTQFQHQVESCTWDAARNKWALEIRDLQTGRTFGDEANVLIAARGLLSNPAWPEIPGLSSFEGKLLHSAIWDETYDYFENKRIGVIGSGSSSIQIVPSLQKLPGTKLSCFVRSKTWISPSFGDSALAKLGRTTDQFTAEERKQLENDPVAYQALRKIVEREGNSIHGLTFRGSALSETIRIAFAADMRSRLAKKPQVAEWMTPSFAPGCRRITPGPGYLEALTEDNVDFITVGIKNVTPKGIELEDGSQVEVDALVCATGFHTSQAPPFPIRGEDGQLLSARFEPYPESNLTLAVDGFPNYFMMLGPNSAIGTGSLTMMIENMGDYIIKCVQKLQKENLASMTIKQGSVKNFSRNCDAYFKKTVYLDNCRSWHRSEGGKGNRITGLWPGSTLHAIFHLKDSVDCLRKIGLCTGGPDRPQVSSRRLNNFITAGPFVT